MQIAKPGFTAVDLATCVYLDIEATGLEPEDEVVAMGIVDAAPAKPELAPATWSRTARTLTAALWATCWTRAPGSTVACWPGRALWGSGHPMQARLLWACIGGSRELLQELCQRLEYLAYLRQQQREWGIALRWTRFINHWWLGLYGRAHWTTRSADPANELAVVFTGTTLGGLELLATHATCYLLPAQGRDHRHPNWP